MMKLYQSIIQTFPSGPTSAMIGPDHSSCWRAGSRNSLSGTGTIFTDLERRDQMARRFCHKRGSVPILFRIVASCVQSVPGSRCETAMMIDLPNFIFIHRNKLVAVRNPSQNTRRPSADRFIVSIRNWHEFGWISVGGRSKHNPFFAEAQPPGVVVGRAEELQIGHGGLVAIAFHLETEEALTECSDFFPFVSTGRESFVSLHRVIQLSSPIGSC